MDNYGRADVENKQFCELLAGVEAFSNSPLQLDKFMFIMLIARCNPISRIRPLPNISPLLIGIGTCTIATACYAQTPLYL